MTDRQDMGVIGADLADDTAVGQLRDAGWDSIILSDDEPDQLYDRPHLSKSFLLSLLDDETLILHLADPCGTSSLTRDAAEGHDCS